MGASLQSFVDSAGVLAPLAFVVAYAALTVALVPGTIGTVAGGALFGAVAGPPLVMLGAVIGATIAFTISRRLGRERVARRLGPRLARLDGWIDGRGFTTVLYLRLLPIVPFSAANYALGLAPVSRREYVAATTLGIAPATVAYVTLGASLSDPLSWRFGVAVAAVVALAIAAPRVERAQRARRTANGAA